MCWVQSRQNINIFYVDLDQLKIVNLFYIQVFQIGRDDLKAIEDFLSSKRYLFGESPCTEDCMIFANTCQIALVDQGPLNKYITSLI